MKRLQIAQVAHAVNAAYCASLGEIYVVVVEYMERQEQGLHG